MKVNTEKLNREDRNFKANFQNFVPMETSDFVKNFPVICTANKLN